MANELVVSTKPTGSLQGNNYNPQQTKPATAVQSTAPAKVFQNTATHAQIQKSKKPSPPPVDYQAIARAEAQRQKTILASVAQSKIDVSFAKHTGQSSLDVKNYMERGKISVAKKWLNPKIEQPYRSQYDLMYDRAYKEAIDEFEAQQKTGNRNFLQKGWDKVVGKDLKLFSAREYAEKKANEIATKGITEYENKLNNFISEQAKRKAVIENAKFLTKTEFDRAVAEFQKWESQNIGGLEDDRARITAGIEAFTAMSSKKSNSAFGKASSFISALPKNLEDNPIFKYTLGSGSKNIPSLATAPTRLANMFGNLNTNNRDIYKHGGEVTNRLNTDNNAWQATFNQRNLNIKPVVDKAFDVKVAFSELNKNKSGNPQLLVYSNAFKKANNEKDKIEIAKKYWDAKNKTARNMNTVQELSADPLLAIGGVGALAKKTGLASRIAKPITNVTSKITSSKIYKWLDAEYKPPEVKLSEAVEQTKNVHSNLIKNILPEIKKINKELNQSQKMDLSVFDDLKQLSDSEARILQRMVDGNLSARDRLLLAGKNLKPTRDKLQDISTKWADFTEKMRVPDNIVNTRFGKGKKTYSPNTTYYQRDLSRYNPKRFKKHTSPQTKDDFYRGAVDRYFVSKVDQQADNLSAKRSGLIDKYNKKLDSERANVQKFYNKTRSPLNRSRRAIGAPMKIWKKSVLHPVLRPAKTVNDILYNIPASVLAGGSKSLTEHIKLLNPRYKRKVLDSIPSEVKSNIAKEIGGKGWAQKFSSGVEDWSRIATYKSLKSKGYTDERAVKRINKYLFDYTTKNWERPLKTVMPFWTWQKNLTRSAIQMPFDRPAGAIAYNRTDKYQQGQYEKDFEEVIPKLKQLGYTDDEIAKIKAENAKFFKGKLKVGDKYYNTPFNAFSEKGLTSIGLNPYLTATGEAMSATDSFGQTTSGKNANFLSRLRSKFPQAELAHKAKLSYDIMTGKSKPRAGWIGKPGSEGYGLGKERQGFDKKAKNYDRKLDPRAKLTQDSLALVGVPRSMEFDKNKLIENKTLQKMTAKYFATDWKSMSYEEQTKKQEALFKSYGYTADDFYKGVLAKYDTDNTSKIKVLKEQAGKANKALFEEYGKQPIGTRNIWATNKLKELLKTGYFDKNPFLKSFKYISPDTVAKANKQVKSQAKYADYLKAKKSGNWADYRRKYGTKNSKFQLGDKYFKSAESMARYQSGIFWNKYANADKENRKKLLADNPLYNTRKDWTQKDWDKWRLDQRADRLVKLKSHKTGSAIFEKYLQKNLSSADDFNRMTAFRKGRKIIRTKKA